MYGVLERITAEKLLQTNQWSMTKKLELKIPKIIVQYIRIHLVDMVTSTLHFNDCNPGNLILSHNVLVWTLVCN